MNKRPFDLPLLLPGIGRLKHDEQGTTSVRYTAIDPATKLFTCTCGKPDCAIAALLPLRDHMASLLRAILSAGYDGQLPGWEGCYESWPGVIYPLRMAASIEDVFADPSYTDDSEAAYWCGPAWDSDEFDREQASKYVAALTIFNFTWMAYEDAIRECSLTEYRRDKLPVQARKYFTKHHGLSDRISGLPYLLRLAKHFCIKGDVLVEDITAIKNKYNLDGLAAAAELARLFRNYIVHGSDTIPIDGQPGGLAFARFYSASRILLLLIQCLIRMQLLDPDKEMPLSQTFDRDTEPAGRIFENLHTKPHLWRSKAQRNDEY